MNRAAAVVLPSRPPSSADWTVERVGGLPHVERLRAGLHRAGVGEVRIVGAGDIAQVHAPASGPLLVIDGRRLYGQAWLEEVARVGTAGDLIEAGRPSGLRIAPAGTRLDAAWADFGRPVPNVPARPVPAGAWSAEVETPEGRRLARAHLRQSLVKPTDGWCARRLNRPVSTRLSMHLAPLRVHPDAATALALAVAIASACCAAIGTWAGFALGGLLFQVASVLDGVDGELARLRLTGSAHGQWLDTVSDDLSNLAYFVGVTIGVARAGYPGWVVSAGLVTVAGDILAVGLMYWSLAARGESSLLAFEADLERPAFGRGRLSGLARRLQPFVKRDAYALIFMLAALAGAPWVPLVATPPALACTLAGVARIVGVPRGSEA